MKREEVLFELEPREVIRRTKTSDGGGAVELELTPEGKEVLEEFKEVVVMVVAGLSGRRHRMKYLLECLGHECTTEAFQSFCLGNEHGISYVGCMDLMVSGQTILIFDVNEANYIDGHEHDSALFHIGLSLASVFVYFHEGDVTFSTLPMLQTIGSFVHTVEAEFLSMSLKANLKTDIFPSMLWVTPHASDSASNALMPPIFRMSNTLGGRAETIKADISKLQHIGCVSDTRSTDFISILFQKTSVKLLVGNRATGKMLASALLIFVQNVNQDISPDVFGAWGDIVRKRCEEISNEAFITYKDCIQSSVESQPPLSAEDFEKGHEQLEQMALDMYDSEAVFEASEAKEVKKLLTARMRGEKERYFAVLSEKSRIFCEELKSTLMASSFADVDKASSFDHFHTTYDDFMVSYNNLAKGPEKQKVLLDFVRQDMMEIFRRVECSVMQSEHSDKLVELESSLKAEWEEKKKILVERIGEQEQKLREGLTKEKDMLQMMSTRSQSKLKILEGEITLLKKELMSEKHTREQLQHDLVALNHTKNELENQAQSLNGELSRKQMDLENTNQAFEAAKAMLEDTLKDSAAKEDEWKKDRARLEEKCEQMSHINRSQVVVVEAHLKKIQEEKQELHAKLNDIYLKVSTLPTSLQEHFFCSPKPEEASFADALLNYMGNDE